MEKKSINDLFKEKVILPGQPVKAEDVEAVQNEFKQKITKQKRLKSVLKGFLGIIVAGAISASAIYGAHKMVYKPLVIDSLQEKIKVRERELEARETKEQISLLQFKYDFYVNGKKIVYDASYPALEKCEMYSDSKNILELRAEIGESFESITRKRSPYFAYDLDAALDENSDESSLPELISVGAMPVKANWDEAFLAKFNAKREIEYLGESYDILSAKLIFAEPIKEPIDWNKRRKDIEFVKTCAIEYKSKNGGNKK